LDLEIGRKARFSPSMKNWIATGILAKHIVIGNIKNQWITKLMKKRRSKNLIASNWLDMQEMYMYFLADILNLKVAYLN
jgi:hypothetical protein